MEEWEHSCWGGVHPRLIQNLDKAGRSREGPGAILHHRGLGGGKGHPGHLLLSHLFPHQPPARATHIPPSGRKTEHLGGNGCLTKSRLLCPSKHLAVIGFRF